MPYWQLPNGAQNVNYHTVPYNYSAQVGWEQYTAAQRSHQRVLQHSQQYNMTTQSPAMNPHSGNHPAISYPPTPPTEQGPRNSSPKPAPFVSLAPKPTRLETPARSDSPLKPTEYGKMSAMKSAILDLAPALYAQRFHSENVCIFSVVTARKNPGSQIAVALIAYLDDNRSRWVNVVPGNKYYDTLKEAMEALLFDMEETMGSLLNFNEEGLLAPLFDVDEESFMTSLLNMDGGEESKTDADKGEVLVEQ